MEFMDIIRARRSIREYRPDPIPEDHLAQILEAGRLAPSTMNWQPWHFGVVTDPELKRELAAASGGQDWIAGAPVVIALCSRLLGDLRELPEDDPWLMSHHLRYGKALIDHLNAHDDRRAIRIFSDTCDVFFAGQQMVLAAQNLGLRSCWIGYLDIDRASRLLELPDDVACTYLLPIGYGAVDPEPIERKSLDDVVFHNTFRE